MKIKNDYYFGKYSSGFFIWNNQKFIMLTSKKFKEALKEANLTINNIEIK